MWNLNQWLILTIKHLVRQIFWSEISAHCSLFLFLLKWMQTKQRRPNTPRRHTLLCENIFSSTAVPCVAGYTHAHIILLLALTSALSFIFFVSLPPFCLSHGRRSSLCQWLYFPTCWTDQWSAACSHFICLLVPNAKRVLLWYPPE